jgi:hypothetical protein
VDSLVETTLSRDIMLMTRVGQPALLRRLFELGCAYSGRILSYHRMLGQLVDAGNTTTLAHYLDLLEAAGLLMGLQKYAGQQARQRASSPKLQVLNTALMTAPCQLTLAEARVDPEYWGRLVESAVGASLANGLRGTQAHLHYWAHRNREVDFVLSAGRRLVAIEVKTGRRTAQLPGMSSFDKTFHPTGKLLVGAQGAGPGDLLPDSAGFVARVEAPAPRSLDVNRPYCVTQIESQPSMGRCGVVGSRLPVTQAVPLPGAQVCSSSTNWQTRSS